MKQCRFCDADIPFYGDDTCFVCKLQADWDSLIRQNSIANTREECAREDLENNF